MAQDLKQRPGCLALFALPFAMVGLAMAVWAGSDLVEWRRMRAWKPVECRILHSELTPHRGSDSTTWRVAARYRYEIGGRVYVNDRVSTTVGSDNIGDFHQALYRRLQAHQRDGTPAVCWVDPGNPRNAVLHREMRWEMFLFKLAFVMAFGGAGFGLMIFALGRVLRARQAKEGEQLVDTARIPSTTTHAGMLLVVALAFLGMSAGVFLPILAEVRAGNYLALLFLLFPLAGMGLLAAAGHGFLRRRRFGRSYLRILSPPAGPGESLRGEVRIPRSMNAQFQVTLQAVLSAGKDESNPRPLWRAGQSRSAMAYAQFSTVDFSFVLPGSLEVPGLSAVPAALVAVLRRLAKGPVPVEWVLDLRADLPGVDYHESFRLPRGAIKMRATLPAGPEATGDQP